MLYIGLYLERLFLLSLLAPSDLISIPKLSPILRLLLPRILWRIQADMISTKSGCFLLIAKSRTDF